MLLAEIVTLMSNASKLGTAQEHSEPQEEVTHIQTTRAAVVFASGPERLDLTIRCKHLNSYSRDVYLQCHTFTISITEQQQGSASIVVVPPASIRS
jgi:hypothetical protein